MQHLNDWPTAPAVGLDLEEDAVHIWQAALHVTEDRQAALLTLLNAEEQARMERLRFEQHRRRFGVARGVLRELLGAYLQRDPAGLVFQQTAAGKPYIYDLFGASELTFNISHSHDMLLVALTRARRIGVDVELRRHISDLQQLADQFFAPDEAAMLHTLPPQQQPRLFLHCWTLKEAYIKALGSGLAKGLSNFSVAFMPGEQPRLLRDVHEPQAPDQWQMFSLLPHPDYVGALAIERLPHAPPLQRLVCRVYAANTSEVWPLE